MTTGHSRPPMLRILSGLLAIVLSGCAGSPDYVYRYQRGRTAILHDGLAAAPSQAPPRVRAAIAAGNRIAGRSYHYGGGHGQRVAAGYDCSGATSYILREAGLMRGSMPSEGFRRYGKKGEGDWISIYARKGHVFLVIAGLRYDTGWKRGPEGPGWTTQRRPTRRYVVRHPGGL